MSKVFISYSRESEAVVKTLARDIEEMGHDPWFDSELSGGQAWWDQILGAIRGADVFVLALAPEALSSVACKREYGYAGALLKPILPVLVADGVSTNLLPPALSALQYVDYRGQDRTGPLRLTRAFNKLPPPKPLPEPLPEPPAVPVSYLGGLRDRIETTEQLLDFAAQSSLLMDLKRSLRDSETAADGRTLLRAFRKRPDLLATIAEEIDQLLANTAGPSPAPRRVVDPPPLPVDPPRTVDPAPIVPPAPVPLVVNKPTMVHRRRGALVGGVIGTILGMMAMSTVQEVQRNPFVLAFGLLLGAGGAIGGAIAGKRMWVTVLMWMGGFVAWVGVTIATQSDKDAFAVGGVFGAPVGIVVGAIVGVILMRRRARQK